MVEGLSGVLVRPLYFTDRGHQDPGNLSWRSAAKLTPGPRALHYAKTDRSVLALYL